MCKRTGSGALARAAEAKYRAVKRAAFVDGCMGRGGGACESTRVCRGGERRGRRNARQKQGGWRKHGRFDDERPINDVAKRGLRESRHEGPRCVVGMQTDNVSENGLDNVSSVYQSAFVHRRHIV